VAFRELIMIDVNEVLRRLQGGAVLSAFSPLLGLRRGGVGPPLVVPMLRLGSSRARDEA
jgi:hypothetical protein